MKRNEIYYADLNPIKGSEQGGNRPVLIIQNDVGNHYSSTTIIAPLTSRQYKAKLPTHVTIHGEGLKDGSLVLLEQIRTIDKSRIDNYIGKLDDASMSRVDKAILVSLGINNLEVLLQ